MSLFFRTIIVDIIIQLACIPKQNVHQKERGKKILPIEQQANVNADSTLISSFLECTINATRYLIPLELRIVAWFFVCGM